MMWPDTDQQKLMSALLECFINISSIVPLVLTLVNSLNHYKRVLMACLSNEMHI